MELRKTDSEDLPRANCTGAVHTNAPRPQLLLVSSTDHRHRPASYGCILKLQLGQRASRLTECSSLLNCICTRESHLHFAFEMYIYIYIYRAANFNLISKNLILKKVNVH